MGVLQEISLMIDHTVLISSDVQLLQELFSTGNQTRTLISIEPIIFGWINLIFSVYIRQAHSQFFTPSKIS